MLIAEQSISIVFFFFSYFYSSLVFSWKLCEPINCHDVQNVSDTISIYFSFSSVIFLVYKNSILAKQISVILTAVVVVVIVAVSIDFQMIFKMVPMVVKYEVPTHELLLCENTAWEMRISSFRDFTMHFT